MSPFDELQRLIKQHPPPPAYPDVLTIITCPEHGGGLRTMAVFQIVDTARQIWRKADVHSLPCGCVVVLPKDESLKGFGGDTAGSEHGSL